MCLLDLPVASMCQLRTHTHIHPVACSALLSCSRRWRRASGVWRHYGRASQHAAAYAHAAQAATTNTNVLRSAGLAANGCTKHNTQKVIVHCYFCSYSTLSSRCCCCCCYTVNLARELSAASVCGHFVVGIFQKFHVFFVLFLHLFTSRHPYTLTSDVHDARNSERDRERERKSACESVEPKTQTNSSSSSSNKAQEITNI